MLVFCVLIAIATCCINSFVFLIYGKDYSTFAFTWHFINFIDNNSPMQWPIKMKFAPLGSPLKSAQLHFKIASFGEQIKKLWGCKSYPYIDNGQVVWPQLLWMYFILNLTWLLCSLMYKPVLIDLISRGFDFVWLNMKFKWTWTYYRYRG